ncbi:cation:proton antiporter [Streptomyces sp. TRM68367]|uniref:cation:proton antiporter n=1 Tax=Streptomyces sp. TRM68367 TaxID=2758415 RepID=UPI00165C0DD6|nr:cation:proton antiporter [Streptomyces sp. TRM68367]MBC9727070.1 cation:proton antiporter [Streptomyces sp. TRM68367]
MSLPHWAALTGHVAIAVAVVLAGAPPARALARRLGQPAVVAEIALGMIAGPLVLRLGGSGALDLLVPADVHTGLDHVGHAGLALFLVGVGHELKSPSVSVRGRMVATTAAGAVVVPLACGGLLAAWVLSTHDPSLRGHAPAPALVLLIAVGLSVTAVPVLARILVSRGILETHVGRLSMTSAVLIDIAAWVLLAVAVGLASGGTGNVPLLLLVVCVSAAVFAVLRTTLRGRWARRAAAGHPRVAAVGIAVLAAGAAAVLREWDLPEILGALLIGVAVPTDGPDWPWTRAVHTVSGVGRALVPVFFVTTGLTVFTREFDGLPWAATAITVFLAVVGKLGGTYAGARMGGASHVDGLRLGVLLNTRGLTELVVLQAGFSAGILTSDLFLAMVVMTLVTTTMTGPVYSLVEARAARGARVAAPPGKQATDPGRQPTARREKESTRP